METNQIYILKNRSFQQNIVKIGMTTKHPSVRAKKIYAGATGVPEPFDVVFACSVVDCKLAERNVHRRLAAFRVNDSREFFRITPKIARQIVLDVCSEVNIGYRSERPVITVDHITITQPELPPSDDYEEKYGEILLLRHNEINSLPIGTTILSKSQKERITVIGAILDEVYPECEETWHDSFSRDRNPETEIRIWEHIAKAFLKFDEIGHLSVDEKKEAYELLLKRSLSPTKTVLQRHNLRHFTKEAALKIMGGYELAPKPITVTRTQPEFLDRKSTKIAVLNSVIPDIIASYKKRFGKSTR
jgi:hypothetical protein